MECKNEWYSLIVYSNANNQVAVGEYCEADGSGRCYRIYLDGAFYGSEYTDLREASNQIEKVAELWHSSRIWRGRKKDVLYTGKRFRLKKLWQVIRFGGTLPYYQVDNNRR